MLQKIQYEKLKCIDDSTDEESGTEVAISAITNTPVSWHPSLEQVPSGCMRSFLIYNFCFLFFYLFIFQIILNFIASCNKILL